MTSQKFWASHRLATAVKQAEQAHKNLQRVQMRARKQGHFFLEQGTEELGRHLARFMADLRGLESVVRAQENLSVGSP